MTEEIDFISDRNRYFSHLLRNQKKYLVGLSLLLSTIVLISNLVKNKPLILGGESYYHLFNALNFSGDKFYYLPLMLVQKVLPEYLLFILLLIIGIGTILLFLKLAKKLELPNKETFLFLAVLILTPAFIFNAVILSGYLFFILLSLIGFLLLANTNKNQNRRWLSIIPFILATFIDFFSSMVLVLIQLIYFSYRETEENEKKRGFQELFIKSFFSKSKNWIFPTTTAFFAIFNLIFLKINLFVGPFHPEKIFPDLISDLGGLNGIGFFIFLLALSGLFFVWKSKDRTTSLIYILTLLTVIGYFFNTGTVFYLSIIASFFAVKSFVKLFDSSWALETLKKFTFLVIILGIIFSTTTYLDRVSDYPPMAGEKDALVWISENTPEGNTVFTLPEESDYAKYFSQREVFYQLHYPFMTGKDAKIKEGEAQTILNSTYTTITFPILNKNNVSLIYIAQEFRQKYPAEQGLLFILKNEKFKLVHSSEGNEVWVYQK